MLKQGRIVALDRTEKLLRMHSGCQVVLRLGGELPAALASRVAERREDGAIRLALPDYAAVEGVMAALREARVGVLEMEILQPDLEDVFVQIMRKA
jgi:ABC-2 type transport system ATP-binding protein